MEVEREEQELLLLGYLLLGGRQEAAPTEMYSVVPPLVGRVEPVPLQGPELVRLEQ